MSFLDHIARCNAHDLSKFVPLIVDGEIAGHIRRDRLVHLERFHDVFSLSDEAVRLADGLETYDVRTAAVEMVVRSLFENGALTGWRGEPYPVGGNWAARTHLKSNGRRRRFSVRVPTGSTSMVSCAAKTVSTCGSRGVPTTGQSAPACSTT